MQEETQEIVREKTPEELELEFEQKMQETLDKILNTEIEVVGDGEEVYLEKIGNIIDKDNDIWFSKFKKKPIINEDGFKKLVAATKVDVDEYEIIEKQSDYNSVAGQVWIEATAKFPNGEINKDYGIANNMNCTDNISKANMPIMALKRARSRAFFRSQTINLPVFDESEVKSDLVNEFKQLRKQTEEAKIEIKNLETRLNGSERKFQTLFNLLTKEIKIDDKLVWFDMDQESLLKQIESGELSKLQEYVARSKTRYNNKINQKES